MDELHRVDWKSLQNRDFQRDNKRPEKVEKYQAEALVHRHLPAHLLDMIACMGSESTSLVQQWVDEAGADVTVRQVTSLYF